MPPQTGVKLRELLSTERTRVLERPAMSKKIKQEEP